MAGHRAALDIERQNWRGNRSHGGESRLVAHYELAAGRPEAARALMNAMIAFANDGGMIPEQVWDAPDIPRRELFFGRPSGSAMPLVWAHAEYVKLARSLREERVFDMPPQTVERYVNCATQSPHLLWRFNQKTRSLPAGRTLRVESLIPAVVHWSADGWRTVEDTATEDTGMGVHKVDLPTREYARGTTVKFTFFWPEAGRWEGTDFDVEIE